MSLSCTTAIEASFPSSSDSIQSRRLLPGSTSSCTITTTLWPWLVGPTAVRIRPHVDGVYKYVKMATKEGGGAEADGSGCSEVEVVGGRHYLPRPQP